MTLCISVLVYCIWHWGDSHDEMHLPLQWGETALIRASQAGKLECVKMLLQGGVQVNVQNKVSAV